MLRDCPVVTTIPVSDMNRAREYYEETLELKPTQENPEGPLYGCGNGTGIILYESSGAGSSQATYAAWTVEDLDAEMKDLKAKGVTFEDYDMPGLKTENGVAENGDMRSAWFKDPDGNILALAELR